ncbi:uncharacterized protein RAG0_15861 [Rhynchosporium agropyri]|uniref:Uncharacterized protein n=1 Tax=Rhynchosporium agropyri TaxID=914238 RepID=A0A1E1LMW7_9HELO|nr:uncharacterized protein RAG0_15861 [Rhynchosporium agropyri]
MRPNRFERRRQAAALGLLGSRTNNRWFQGPFDQHDQFKTGVIRPGASADAPNTIHIVHDGLSDISPLSLPPSALPLVSDNACRVSRLDPEAAAFAPHTIHVRYDGPRTLPPLPYRPSTPSDSLGQDNTPLLLQYKTQSRELEKPRTTPNPSKSHTTYLRNRRNMDQKVEVVVGNSTNDKTNNAVALADSAAIMVGDKAGRETTEVHVQEQDMTLALYIEKTKQSVSPADKTAQVWDYVAGLDGPSSPPESFKDFLKTRSTTAIPGPTSRPADDPKPELVDVLRLFERFRKSTPRCAMFETNHRIMELPGNPHTLWNIATVAKDCSDRYKRTRLALLQALEQFLKAERFVSQTLGYKIDWDRVGVDKHIGGTVIDAKNHIHRVMLILHDAEARLQSCTYNGEWNDAWSHIPELKGKANKIRYPEKNFEERGDLPRGWETWMVKIRKPQKENGV